MNARHQGTQLDVLRPTQVRDVNATAILRLLLARGAMPRAGIADELGLTQGPVTRITTQLAQAGLVQELEPISSTGRGRPRIPLSVVTESRQIIAVHIGVEHIAIGLTNLVGTPLSQRRYTYDGTVDTAMDLIAERVQALAGSARSLLGLGVLIGGWVDPQTGTVRRHPVLNWENVPLQQLLTDRTGQPVHVESNVRAHAIADLVHGAASDGSSFLHVFIGNVIEVAVVMNGRVHSAPNGFGGALSAWPVPDSDDQVRAARDVIGDQGVVQKARDQWLLDDVGTFDDVLSLARGSGDRAGRAAQLLHTRAFAAGELIAQLNAAIAPDLIVVSSGVLYLDGSLEQVQRGADSSALTLQSPRIRSGNTPGNSALTAAATIVLDRTILAHAGLKAILSEQRVARTAADAAPPEGVGPNRSAR